MSRDVADAAAAWFVRLEGETATADDWLAFEHWLLASAAHMAAFERLERLSAELNAMSGGLAAALETPMPAPRRTRATPGAAAAPRLAWFAAGGAAIAACLAAALVMVAQPQLAQMPATTYRAAPGQTRTVRLADGTQLRMNASSTLSVSFAADARRVILADAEATFDVTHDPKRPFLIAVGDTQVRVVGTEFNLRHRGGSTELTVRRGVVEVRPAAGQAIKVAAGHRFERRDGSSTAALTPADADEAFAWTQGQLVYRDRPLADVAADLSRRFGAPVLIADRRTGELRFTGVLVTDNEAAVLRRLENFAPVKAIRTTDGVVLKGR